MDFVITAEAGASVVVKDGNTVIVNIPVMPAAPFVVNPFLADGTHLLSVEVTDTAGNVSHQSEELVVEVDTQAPAPSAVTLAPYSDTGVVGDNITSERQPAFVGRAEANARIHLLANGTLIGTAVVQSDESDGDDTNGLGIWELTSEPLADGDYEIVALVEDVAATSASRTRCRCASRSWARARNGRRSTWSTVTTRAPRSSTTSQSATPTCCRKPRSPTSASRPIPVRRW
jgi:hypothetical protein